jgi:hypothetical protein
MSDLFARLAERALNGAVSATRAAPEPEHGQAALEEPGGASESAGTAAAQPLPEAPVGGDDRERALAPAPPAPLAPMPTVIPPVIERRLMEPAAAAPAPPAAAEPRPPAPPVAVPAPPAPAPPRRGASSPPLRPSAPPHTGRLVALQPAPPEPPRRSGGPPTTRPAVEVTIGRVEVRVRPPNAGPPQRRPSAPAPPPALSLDEYLRQREASS